MSSNTQQEPHVDDGNIPNDPLTDHSYDGIREFDNPMPGWWKALFWGSIVWSAAYWLYYENGVTPDRSVVAAYDRALAANMEKQFAEIGELQPDRATILKFAEDPKWLAFGKSVFQTNCVSCHGNNAEGKIGPNLTDDKWKNVKKVEDIPKVISNGAGGNAMPAWKDKLNQNEIVLLASYLLSVHGSVPPGTGVAPIKGETNVISDLDASADEPATEEAQPSDNPAKAEAAKAEAEPKEGDASK
ncbi:cytochrome C oxidase Cbb3 [Bremerella cremea]|uniref:Cytochrome C oxidase Cbb3 n=1 Tax=Blastopirellula marina TaxID=124 RepID=A0A2S8FYU1_9BACT|nr:MULTISPECIES: cbb3-type cytochrome c oxidase N-terminal domain-containing protein [Pirellulaceae]PQO37353.1 cytochrome C oxidase Cbb3 [Blastopirellula marina]RCS49740.1 cytochrome C oxidase Cbb3 [Bremerella cremea]